MDMREAENEEMVLSDKKDDVESDDQMRVPHINVSELDKEVFGRIRGPPNKQSRQMLSNDVSDSKPTVSRQNFNRNSNTGNFSQVDSSIQNESMHNSHK